MKKKHALLAVIFLGAQVVQFGCALAPQYLKGVNPDGQKVYLGPVPIQNTEAYQAFLTSSRSEAAKLDYLLQRIKSARDLVYHYDGEQYNWLEAYRAGSWILRHHYERGESARSFLLRETFLYQKPGKPNAVEFPDRSVHFDYHVLINELDLLEETVKENPNV